MYSQIRANIPEKAEKELKLEQILSAMDRKKKAEEYYSTKPPTPEELERRREQVRNRPKLFA